MAPQPEYWQAGPIEGIIPLLQPVAHAILQMKSEVHDAMKDFRHELLWKREVQQSGNPEVRKEVIGHVSESELNATYIASIGFHLQHIPGVLDRLFTYAKGNSLSAEQFVYLEKEGKSDDSISVEQLLYALDHQVEQSLLQLRDTREEELLIKREVGRKKIPSNTIGLLFHAAEHCQRHLGQLLVTAKVMA